MKSQSATPPDSAGAGALKTESPVSTPTERVQFSREQSRAMWSRASAAERTRYFVASRDRLTSLEFDPNTQLTPEDRGEILAQLSLIAAARPIAIKSAGAAPQGSPKTPRRMSVLELARVRREIQKILPPAGGAELLRQVIWAVEQGALQRFTVTMAVNIALKKIREGAWSRPHRMPPNWLPRESKTTHAQPEPCSAA